MLRTTISKIKKVCSVAFLPRIFRGDQQYVACKFDIFSSPAFKKVQKSTKSGDDDALEQKTEKGDPLKDHQLSSRAADIEAQGEKTESKTQGEGLSNIAQVVASEPPEKIKHRERVQRIIEKTFGREGEEVTYENETIDTFQYFTKSQHKLEETKREIAKGVESFKLSNFTQDAIEKPLPDVRIPFCGSPKDESVEPDDLLINEPIFKVSGVAELHKARLQEKEDLKFNALNVSATEIKRDEDELYEPTLTACPACTPKEYAIQMEEEEQAELLKPAAAIVTSDTKDLSEFISNTTEASTKAYEPRSLAEENESVNFTTPELRKAESLTPKKDLSGFMSETTEASNKAYEPRSISEGYERVNFTTPELKKAQPLTPKKDLDEFMSETTEAKAYEPRSLAEENEKVNFTTPELRKAEPLTPKKDLNELISKKTTETSTKAYEPRRPAEEIERVYFTTPELKKAQTLTPKKDLSEFMSETTEAKAYEPKSLAEENEKVNFTTPELGKAELLTPKKDLNEFISKKTTETSTKAYEPRRPAEEIERVYFTTPELKKAQPLTPKSKVAKPITPESIISAPITPVSNVAGPITSGKKYAEPLTPNRPRVATGVKTAEPVTPQSPVVRKVKTAEPVTPLSLTNNPLVNLFKKDKKGGKGEIIADKTVPTPVEDAPLEGAVRIGSVYTADSDRYTLDAIDSFDADDAPPAKAKAKEKQVTSEIPSTSTQIDKGGVPSLEPNMDKAVAYEDIHENVPYTSLAGAVARHGYDPSYMFDKAPQWYKDQDNKVHTTTAKEKEKEKEESLAQKIEKIDETPLVEAAKPNIQGFHITPRELGKYHVPGVCDHEPTKVNIPTSLDEVAKRCLDSPTSQIDEILLKEMEKLGIPITSHRDSNTRSPALEQDVVQMGMLKKPRRRPVENEDLDLDMEPVNFPSATERMKPMQMMSKESVLPNTTEPLDKFEEYTDKLEIRPNQGVIDNKNSLTYDSEKYNAPKAKFVAPIRKPDERIREEEASNMYEKEELKILEREAMRLMEDPAVLTSADKTPNSPPGGVSKEPQIGSKKGEVETESDQLGVTPYNITVPKGMFNPFRTDPFREETAETPTDRIPPAYTISIRNKSSVSKPPTSKGAPEKPKRLFYTSAFEEHISHGEILLDYAQPMFATKSQRVSTSNLKENKPGIFWSHDQLDPQYVLTCNETCPISPNAIVKDCDPSDNKSANDKDISLQTISMSLKLHTSTTNQPFNILFSDTVAEAAQESRAGNTWVFQGGQLEKEPAQGLSVNEETGQIRYRTPEVITDIASSNLLLKDTVQFAKFDQESSEQGKAKVTRKYDDTVDFAKEDITPEEITKQDTKSKIGYDEVADASKEELLPEEESKDNTKAKIGYEDKAELTKEDLQPQEATDEQKSKIGYETPKESGTVKFENLQFMSKQARQTFEELIRSCPAHVAVKKTTPETIDAGYDMTKLKPGPSRTVAEEPVMLMDPNVRPAYPLAKFEQEVVKAAQRDFSASKHMQTASVLNPMPAKEMEDDTTIPITFQPLPRFDENVPLSELLKRVRQRSRLLAAQYHFSVEADPATAVGKCPRKAPKCVPTAPRSPPSEPIPVPPLGLPPIKRRPPACKPRRRRPKKAKCTACDMNQLNPSGIYTISENVQDLGAPRLTVDLTDDVIYRLQNLGKVLGQAIRDRKTEILEHSALRMTDRVPRLKFARDYTPWTPIPSWPIQPKPKKKTNERIIPERCFPGCRNRMKEVQTPCPKPCSYPTKNFCIFDCFAVSLGDYNVVDLGDF